LLTLYLCPSVCPVGKDNSNDPQLTGGLLQLLLSVVTNHNPNTNSNTSNTSDTTSLNTNTNTSNTSSDNNISFLTPKELTFSTQQQLAIVCKRVLCGDFDINTNINNTHINSDTNTTNTTTIGGVSKGMVKAICWNYSLCSDISCILHYHPDIDVNNVNVNNTNNDTTKNNSSSISTNTNTTQSVHSQLMSSMQPYDIIPIWDKLNNYNNNTGQVGTVVPVGSVGPVGMAESRECVMVLTELMAYALSTYSKQKHMNHQDFDPLLYTLATLCNHILTNNLTLLNTNNNTNTISNNIILTEELVSSMSLLFQIVDNTTGVDLLLQNLFTINNNSSSSNSGNSNSIIEIELSTIPTTPNTNTLNIDSSNITNVPISETTFIHLSECLLKQNNSISSSKLLLLFQKFSEQSCFVNQSVIDSNNNSNISNNNIGSIVRMRDIDNDDKTIQQSTLRKLISNNKLLYTPNNTTNTTNNNTTNATNKASTRHGNNKNNNLPQPKAPTLRHCPYHLSTYKAYIPLFKTLLELNELDLVLETLKDMVMVKGMCVIVCIGVGLCVYGIVCMYGIVCVYRVYISVCIGVCMGL